jgi:hypothetical protein
MHGGGLWGGGQRRRSCFRISWSGTR